MVVVGKQLLKRKYLAPLQKVFFKIWHLNFQLFCKEKFIVDNDKEKANLKAHQLWTHFLKHCTGGETKPSDTKLKTSCFTFKLYNYS